MTTVQVSLVSTTIRTQKTIVKLYVACHRLDIELIESIYPIILLLEPPSNEVLEKRNLPLHVKLSIHLVSRMVFAWKRKCSPGRGVTAWRSFSQGE